MPEVKLTLDAAQYLMAMAEAGRAEQKQEANMRKSARAAAEWEREEKRAAEAAKQRSAERAQQSYNELAAEQRLHQERQRAYTEMGQKLDAIAAKNRAAFQASQSAAQQHIAGLQGAAMMPPHLRHQNMIFNPMAPNVQALQAARQAMNQLTVNTRAQQQAAAAAGQAGQGAFGSQALQAIDAYVTGMLSIGAAIGVVKKAFDSVPEARNKALGSLNDVYDARAKLLQISGGSRAANAANQVKADELYQKGVPRNEAAEIVFAARSGELSEAQLQKAGRAALFGPGVGVKAAQFETSIKDIYKGKISPEKALDVAFKAAADAPKLSFEQFVEQSPEAMNVAEELGLSYPEYAAIQTKMSGQFGIGEQAFARSSLIMGRMALKKQWRGKGMAGFKDLTGKSDDELLDFAGGGEDTSGMTEEQRDEFIGKRKEMHQALLALRKSMPEIPGYAAELERAGGVNQIEAGIKAMTPIQKKQVELRQQQAIETTTRERALGEGATDIQSLFAAERSKDERRGAWGTQRLGRSTYQAIAYGLNVNPGTAHAMSEFGSAMGTGGPWAAMPQALDVWSRLIGVNNDQAAALKEISDNIKAIRQSNADMAGEKPRLPPPTPVGGGRR